MPSLFIEISSPTGPRASPLRLDRGVVSPRNSSNQHGVFPVLLHGILPREYLRESFMEGGEEGGLGSACVLRTLTADYAALRRRWLGAVLEDG